MSAEPTTVKAAERARVELNKAVEQATLAYEFVPNSYTYGALQACLAAEHALEVLRSALG
jgi:hypothetical protein